MCVTSDTRFAYALLPDIGLRGTHLGDMNYDRIDCWRWHWWADLALSLIRLMPCRVFEAVPELAPLGVGIIFSRTRYANWTSLVYWPSWTRLVSGPRKWLSVIAGQNHLAEPRVYSPVTPLVSPSR